MNDQILAKAFSCANDEEQAEMLNSFARELFVVCGGRYGRDSRGGYEGQCCNITRHLNKDGEQLIRDLNAFIELRKKEMK
jgi:hypothetical protein